MTNLDKVRNIITEAGGKSYRRPYDEDDMQNLRDAIWDVVRKWARRRIFGYPPGYPNGYYDDDLAELDVKRMALYALCLSILDIEDVGETVEDMDAFVPEAVYELECLIACFRGLARPKKPDGVSGRPAMTITPPSPVEIEDLRRRLQGRERED